MNTCKINELKLKLDYLEYKNGIEKLNMGANYELIFRLLQNLSGYNICDSDAITLDEVKKDAINFYSKYFNIHNIKTSTMEDLKKICSNLKADSEVLKAYCDYYNFVKESSPFDLPIVLVDGHSMVGNVEKPLMIIPNKSIPSDCEVFVPFSTIQLGNDLTKISSSTYIHEIAHTQQESNPGYAESYLNKELISIFLEKISNLELDPTGKNLLNSERKRFAHILGLFDSLKSDIISHKLTEDTKLENYTYIQSTLLAQKMFDMYLQERKQKNKDQYIYEIQDIFDGKKTVEEMLTKKNITLNKSLDINLIKRHI